MSYVDNLSGQFGELGIGGGRPGSQPYQPHSPGKGFIKFIFVDINGIYS